MGQTEDNYLEELKEQVDVSLAKEDGTGAPIICLRMRSRKCPTYAFSTG